jgi:adenylate kinase
LIEKNPDVFSYLSTGDVFRALGSAPNAIGDYVKDRIAAGQLIDDKVTNAIFESYYFTVADSGKYMLLDGYPRSVAQMRMMIAFLMQQQRKVLGINFVLDDMTAIDRMKSRGRNDDTDESIKARIMQFKEKTVPVIELFADHFPVINIDASKSIDEIHALVTEAVI